MKYFTLFIISILVNQIYSNYCKPFSSIQSANYVNYFPKLSNYQNSQIIEAVQNFNFITQSGKGGHGIVKKFKFDHKGGYQKVLALKKISKQMTRNKLISLIEDEVVQWNKVVNSSYVPYYYACFEGPNNSSISEVNSIYILQESLNFDLQQKPLVDGQKNPLNIKQKMPRMKDRIGFYIKLFKAIDNISSYSFVHNDIKPQNIMVDNRGYNGDPIIIDFGISESLPSEPINSTPCYEFKGKQFLSDNTTKFDVFSMGISIIEFETDFASLCSLYNTQLPKYYNSFQLSSAEIQQFYRYVLNSLGLRTIQPIVQDISQCQDLVCIITFTVQPDINNIPSATQVINSLTNLQNNMERIRII